MYSEDDYLMISGIQHFLFCRRQWALIHVEKQWADNVLTYEGQQLHTRADEPKLREKRHDLLTTHALKVHSPQLGLSGICDIVEFRQDPEGAKLFGRQKRYQPEAVEYKRGRAKWDLSDTYQLLAQTLCLEEMFSVSINQGWLYYFETNKRQKVVFTAEQREDLKKKVDEMHQYWAKGYTPKVKTGKWCQRCSLKDICLPELLKNRSVPDYFQRRLTE
ncbi:MAG: CRISPR-associated protein Cas4 [Lactobacillus sp.]|jgi:CRISPR-associated exonuclease Cas4|nr:CRISPR-associated protein Cas4 [Lactobacillus sp.]